MQTEHPNQIPYIKNLQELTTVNNVFHMWFQKVVEDPDVDVMFKMFDTFGEVLKDQGSMATFWMSYMELSSLLLELIRSSRDWTTGLHMAAIRTIIPVPWCSAYDRQNYAKYLSVYYTDMVNLPTESAEVYHQLT